ncbi:MAG: hydroxymethylbilane synthase [Thermodesulfovibrionales bacterium]|nr:hydroxymethylbilane synthase [Thermodesulfovibrionales bacterium]
MKKNIVIGTRGSKLALWQAEWVRSQLLKLYPYLNIELHKIKTTGDKILDVPLAKIGGKGLFVKEIEEALLNKTIDIAVHSMKDVPTELPKGLHLLAICEREDPRDAFVSPLKGSTAEVKSFFHLPKGAILGTSSLRRSCQLLNKRPDLKVVSLRGNLDTRLKKLDEGQYNAIILAVAGVKRLGLAERITEVLSTDVCLPAIGQGAIGIEARLDDEYINELIKPLNHYQTWMCVSAERAFLKKLEGGCQVPIAAFARLEPTLISSTKENLNTKNDEISRGNNKYKLIIEGLISDLKGERVIKSQLSGDPRRAEEIGKELAEELLYSGAKKILQEVYNEKR